MTSRQLWTALHGVGLGALFLLAFSGGFIALLSLRNRWITPAGQARIGRSLAVWTCGMAILAWLTVIAGTWVVYPWYRAKPPAALSGTAVAAYPRSLLLSDPTMSGWHELGMEWKEHIAWLAPMLATAVAFVVTRYRRQVADDDLLRRTLLALFGVAFFCAAVAGFFGAMINKMAPIR